VSFLSALEAFSQEIQRDVIQAHFFESSGDEALKQYLEYRQLKEGEAVSEMIGPLLSGKLPCVYL
jgi:hypothetical protein